MGVLAWPGRGLPFLAFANHRAPLVGVVRDGSGHVFHDE